MLLYLIKLPESVRWAWSVGKIEVANDVIKKMAIFNNVDIPEKHILKTKIVKEGPRQVGMVALLTSKPLRGRLVVMGFNWIVATLCYYGLSLTAGIGSDVFAKFTVTAIMEIPAYTFTALVNLQMI
jgi:hypothetical protein